MVFVFPLMITDIEVVHRLQAHDGSIFFRCQADLLLEQLIEMSLRAGNIFEYLPDSDITLMLVDGIHCTDDAPIGCKLYPLGQQLQQRTDTVRRQPVQESSTMLPSRFRREMDATLLTNVGMAAPAMA